MYKLKPNQPDFECVDGPFAGRKFKAGQMYLEIPQNESHKFDLAEKKQVLTTEHTEDSEVASEKALAMTRQRRRGTE